MHGRQMHKIWIPWLRNELHVRFSICHAHSTSSFRWCWQLPLWLFVRFMKVLSCVWLVMWKCLCSLMFEKVTIACAFLVLVNLIWANDDACEKNWYTGWLQLPAGKPHLVVKSWQHLHKHHSSLQNLTLDIEPIAPSLTWTLHLRTRFAN